MMRNRFNRMLGAGGVRDAAARNFLATFIASGEFRRLLEDILADSERADMLAAFSHVHENGFVKLLLGRTPDGDFSLRLHLWPRTDGGSQNIHDHRFDFWSTVLSGGIVNHIWRAGTGLEHGHYRYFPREDRNSYAMPLVGTAFLEKTECFATGQGETYYFDNSKLHTVECATQTVTLFLEDRRSIRPFANVYSLRHSAPVTELAAPGLTIEAYRSILDAQRRQA